MGSFHLPKCASNSNRYGWLPTEGVAKLAMATTLSVVGNECITRILWNLDIHPSEVFFYLLICPSRRIGGPRLCK